MANLKVLVNLIKQGNGAQLAKDDLKGVDFSAKEAEISVRALDKRYAQLITEVGKGNKTVDQAQREYRDFARQLGVTERATQDVEFSFTELNQALELGGKAFDLVRNGAELALDALERGTEVKALQNTFENLAGPLGDTNQLLLDLQTNTNNAVTNTLLLRGANKALNLGLAETDGELVQLVGNAAALGANLGDVGGTIDDVLAAIANESKLRLDNFGVAADRVEELQAELQAAGEEGTFAQAVMLALEETVERTGARANLAASDVDILKTAIENAKDQAALAATEGFGPLIQTLNDVGAIEGFGNFISDIGSAVGAMSVQVAILTNDTIPLRERFQAIADVNEEIRDEMGGWTVDYQRELVLFRAKYDELTGSAEQFAEVTGDLAAGQIGPLTREQAAAQQEVIEVQTGLIRSTEKLTAEQVEQNRQYLNSLRLIPGYRNLTDQMADSHDQLAPAVRTSTNAIEDAGDAIDYLSVRQDVLSDALQRSVDSTEAYNSTLGGYFVEASRAGDETLTASEQLYELAIAGNAGIDTISGLAVSLGIMSPEMAQAYLESAILKGNLDELFAAIQAGKLDVDLADEAVEALTSGFASNAAEAINAATASDLYSTAISNIPDVTIKKLIFEVSQTGEVTGVSNIGGGPTITRHDGGPAAAGQPYLVGDGPGGSFIPGATELFIPGQSGHIVSNRQVEQAIASMTNSNNRSFTDRSTVNFNLRGSRSTLREAKRQRHRRTARSMGRLING